jgi:recombinational DNA repair protein RecR
VQISYLASGIPVGASLEFVDKLTLGKAFNYRRKI